MNILFLDWPCFGRNDVLDYLKKENHNVTLFSHPDYDLRISDSFTKTHLISAFPIIIFHYWLPHAILII